MLAAQILEHDPSGGEGRALSEALRLHPGEGLEGALSRLAAAERRRILGRWGEAAAELRALSRELDPALFQEGLLGLGLRLEAEDRLEEAGTLYSALAANEDPAGSRARARLDAIAGAGDSGARLEFLGRRLAREACRPEMLLAMGAAGAAFRFTRLALASRLSGSLGNLWALRGAANAGGFLAETLAFTGTAKLAGAAFGARQDWSGQAWLREWAGGAMMLLGLKAMGSLSQAAARRWAQGPGGLELFTRAALPQAGMLGGIFLGHRLEEWAGLRRPQANATAWVDSLATLLQFNVGARLLHRATGGRLPAWERALDIGGEAILRGETRPRATTRAGSPPLISLDLFGGRRPAVVGAPGAESILMMNQDGGEGGRPSVSAEAGLPSGESPQIRPQGAETRGAPSGGKSGSPPETTVAKAEGTSPETQRHPGFDPHEARYHLPRTEYFRGLAETLSFEKLVGYAQAETRAGLVGINLRNSLLIPMDGPLEYSPYGAGLVERLRENPEAVHTLTGKWDRALVASPGTAILGLGSAAITADHLLRAEAADAIMQGKAKYFLWTAGVSATPLCVRSHFSPEQLRQLEAMEPRRRAEQARVWRAERFAETVRALAPNFGFINIEDAQGKDLPLIFGVLESLRGDTAIWSDDKQGTGVITAAAMLSWAELTGRLDSAQRMSNARGVIFGAGAGAMGVYDELVHHGILPENILVTDSRGPLHEGRTDVTGDPYKLRMREGIREGTAVEAFARGADFLLNLGVKETLTDNIAWTEFLVRSLAPNPFFGAMTNPEPGISPQMLRGARPDAFYGSGNQTYENPVNNFTAFGYIGAGAMMARAGAISPAMTVAAARGIFEVAKLGPPESLRDGLPESQREFGRHWLVPRPDDIRLIERESGAVARAAARDGLAILLGAGPSPAELARFDREIEDALAFRTWSVARMREEIASQGRNYLVGRYPRRYAPFALTRNGEPSFEVAPEIRRDHFEHFARQLGLRPERWQDLLTPEGELQATALATALERLRPATEGDGPAARTAFQELKLLTQIAAISPSLGLALALRRGRVRSENLAARPTVFHREAVLRTVLHLIPEARVPLEHAFPDLPEIP
ncbi:MAG: NADP-dependent malic enzyme [Deltaproteobacteria bacterium]|nr:NADP-dependent malic enzyme [Deltaproteobacteria bacterium]